MENVKEAKRGLRRRLRQKAAGFGTAYLAASDEAITKAVLALPGWQAAKTVFCYVSVRTEPDTRALIKAALDAGKRVCVPLCLGGGVMEAKRIEDFSSLGPGVFGLLEPAATLPVVPPEEIDLVIAPCVACDAAGRRLGNGAGYYDSYLAKVRCPVVCLCRGRLLQQHIPQEDFDRRVDVVVSEKGVINLP